MDLEVLEPVLKELLNQQQEILAEREKEREARQQLFLKLEAVNKKLDTLKSPVSIEASTLLIAIKNGIDEVKWLQEAQTKTGVHEKSFQLFSNKSEEFYKLIFGNLFKGLIYLIISIYTLVIINRYIREREYLHYKQAWQYLYKIQNEEEKQFLEKIMKVSEKGDLSLEARPDTQSRKAIPKSIAKPAKK